VKFVPAIKLRHFYRDWSESAAEIGAKRREIGVSWDPYNREVEQTAADLKVTGAFSGNSFARTLHSNDCVI